MLVSPTIKIARYPRNILTEDGFYKAAWQVLSVLSQNLSGGTEENN
jgi:hypothetical protein